MAGFVAFCSVVGIVAVVIAMFKGSQYQHLGLVNFRNIFLLGFIYFQLYAVVYPLWAGDFADFQVIKPGASAVRFMAYTSLFLACFFFIYQLVIRRLDRVSMRPVFRGTQSSVALVVLALVATAIAYVGRFSGFIPLVGPLLNHVLVAMAATSAAIAAWVISRNSSNPVLVVPSLCVIGIGAFNTILADFGRRGLVGILGACMWAAYFSRDRWVPRKRVWLRLMPLIVVGIVLVGAFTQARGQRDLQGQAAARTREIANNIGYDAARKLFSVPDTGIASLWLIDSRRDSFAYEHLFAARYFFLHMVPRAVLPNKVEPLSRRIPIEANKKGVALGLHTIGPGVIGHAAADGGFYAAVVYGLCCGWVLALLDRFLAVNQHSPLAVAAMGCTLGQVLGLSRGDSSIFLGIILIGVVSNLMIFWMVDRSVGQPAGAGRHG